MIKSQKQNRLKGGVRFYSVFFVFRSDDDCGCAASSSDKSLHSMTIKMKRAKSRRKFFSCKNQRLVNLYCMSVDIYGPDIEDDWDDEWEESGELEWKLEERRSYGQRSSISTLIDNKIKWWKVLQE